ncbi:DUF2507 domain-containing protein [Lentilactobacillus buchneri]|uniref:DUF2507 domain-containing protein n=1 Tax=Lentilactobacillus buchneri DSM 20057 TaxID=1423728 RepID=A0A4R5NN26_LENBU|nr:DUF2507 domain-containing protein [Lentilactobacillus buchneri]KRK68592.1 hypothetical protein FC79_GL000412 [Lentilactobacillus buchneri DSM 20057]MCT3252991.1 DUF2507 domain-containing protein [Lentilactobacillus buchneri]MCT3547585.1 DUF2507 domain-containing protein [Lentilactobacillus buchneri]MCT4437987.1 DUF2507 domain-containing protein [Lentilactobacillus buchneri]MQM70387.1 DUF2507 domain-containing protein [Lentilactobacillus buchneri]
MDNEVYKHFMTDDTMRDLLGQELIRDSLIPEILGKDVHEISYWAGKHLARDHRLATYEDLETFFKQFKFGDLKLLKRSGNQISWQLSGKIVAQRLNAFDDPDFYLESGFIAQSCQYILNQQAEAELEKANVNKGFVLLSTYLSPDKPTDGQEASAIFEIVQPDPDDNSKPDD